MGRLTEEEIQVTVATITKQIGDKAFVMMGAKYLTHSLENNMATLNFKIGTNAARITHIKVSYDSGKDTYIVRFLKIGSVVSSKEVEDVHCDQLHSVIETNTGLFLSL